MIGGDRLCNRIETDPGAPGSLAATIRLPSKLVDTDMRLLHATDCKRPHTSRSIERVAAAAAPPGQTRNRPPPGRPSTAGIAVPLPWL